MDKIREKICRTALVAVSVTKERRQRDLERIRNSFAEFDTSVFSRNFISDVFAAYREHLRDLCALALPFRSTDYLTANGQVIPAQESDYATWILFVTDYLKVFESQVTEVFEKSVSGADFLAKLFSFALSDSFSEDALLNGPGNGITAFEAKVFLCYSLPLERRKKLFDRLELRFDLRDVSPRQYSDELNRIAQESSYDCSVITDGYFYGALRANARAYVQGAPESIGLGIDCSTLFQECCESAGFSPELFKSPISTKDVVRGDFPGLHLGAFEKKPFQSFDLLLPGDGIFWEGHVVVCVARDSSGRMRVAEALGRRYRTVREAIFPINEVTAKGFVEYEGVRRQLYVVSPKNTRGVR